MTHFTIVCLINNNSIDEVLNTLTSLKLQSVGNYQLIIKSSQSPGCDLAVVKKFCNANFENWVLVKRADANIYDGLNQAIERALGEYIGVLHVGDRFDEPDVLYRYLRCMYEKPGFDCYYGGIKYIKFRDNQEKVVRLWLDTNSYDARLFKYGWMFPHTSMFVRTQLLAEDKYDISFKISADYQMMLKIFYAKNCTAFNTKIFSTKMIAGGTSYGLKNVRVRMCEDLKALRTVGLGKSTLIMKSIRKTPQFINNFGSL